MELILVKAAAALALPPGGNIVLGIAGLVLWRRARVLAAILITGLRVSHPRVRADEAGLA